MFSNFTYMNRLPSLALGSTVATLMVVLVGLVWASPAWANTISVRTSEDEDNVENGICSLRTAIFNANDNQQSTDPTDCEPGSSTEVDTIRFDVDAFDPPGSPATIKLDLGALPTITDPAGLRIEGQTRNGEDVDITISGDNSVRVFEVADGAALTLKNLTMTGGLDSAEGGGILNQGGTLTVTDSTLSGSSAQKGGGLANNDGTVEVTNSTISDNSATGQDNPSGGGIFNGDSGTLTITDTTFSGNSATDPEGLTKTTGGGIANDNGALTVTNSTFSGNFTLSKDEDSPNAPPPQKETFGGGIYSSDASQSSESVKVSNSTFSGNSASDGGGIYNDRGEVKVTNSTFSENSATGPAGDEPTIPVGAAITANVFQEEASTFLTNTIVANPTQGQNCFGLIIDGGYNIAYGDPDDPEVTNDGHSCDFPTSTSKNNTNPELDPDGLQDNGGPTMTIALEVTQGWCTSPTIDQGNSSDFTTDQRGETRPHDFANVPNAPGIIGGTESDGSDIGAFELQQLDPPPNLAQPVANNDSYSVNEDNALNVAALGVLGNDTDADDDPLTAELVDGVDHGTLTLNTDGSFTYKPAANFNGSDSFTYKAKNCGSDSNVATVSITVNPVNDAPKAVGDSYSTNEDNPLTVSAPGVLGNDTDVDNPNNTNAGLTVKDAQPVSGPSNGTLTINASGSFTYTPNNNYNGSDSFTYKATDGTADSNTATVNITVNVVNDVPVAVANSYSTNEDTALTGATPGVLGNDSDPDAGDTLTAVLVSSPSHGALTFNENGSFSYTPDANYNGPDSYSYKTRDTAGAESTPVTVSITVKAVNDPPTATVAVGGSCSTTSVSGTVNLTVGDVETEATSLTLSASSSNTILVPNGNIVFGGSGANRTVTITPAAKRSGNATITITVSDGAATNGTTIKVIVGTDKKETINGTSGSDMIFGLNGDDTINAGNANDLVCGGNSGGVISGGSGDDTLDGGNGNDTLKGEDGNDILLGGQGNDRLEGGNNNDTLSGGMGADFFSGGPGTDTATDFTPSRGDTQDTIP